MLKNRRLERFIRLCAIGLLACLLIAPGAFASQNGFPNVPLIPGFTIPFPLDMLFFFVLIMSTFMIVIQPVKGLWLWISLAVFLLFLASDINCLQPYFLLFYLLMLARRGYANYLPPHREKQLIALWRLSIAGMYLWSGLLKINPAFANAFFPQIPIHFLPAGLGPNVIHFLGYIPGAIEALLALLLLSPKWRRVSVIVLAIMHALILLWLSPLGVDWNRAVWPWNIFMIFCLFSLFWAKEDQRLKYEHPVKLIKGKIYVLIFWLLPFLNIFNLWDHNLSWGMYSFRTPFARYYIERDCIQNLPEPVMKNLRVDDSGDVYLPPNGWSYTATGSLVYPQVWVHQKIAEELESKLDSGCEIEIRYYDARSNSILP